MLGHDLDLVVRSKLASNPAVADHHAVVSLIAHDNDLKIGYDPNDFEYSQQMFE